MPENVYLTPNEQAIYRLIEKTEIITFEAIQDVFPALGRQSLRNLISDLTKKGYLFRLKNGLYLVTKNGALEMSNPLRLATEIYTGYIGFGSALRVHNLTAYEPFTIFVVTCTISRSKTIGDYLFKYIAMGARATGVEYRDGFAVSTIEKTFFDCIYRPQYAGGYEEVTKAIFDHENIDWGQFLRYIQEFASAALCQRIGYLLELMISVTGCSIPETVILYLRSRLRSPTRLLPLGSTHGTYSHVWKVLDNLGPDRILGWWYGA